MDECKVKESLSQMIALTLSKMSDSQAQSIARTFAMEMLPSTGANIEFQNLVLDGCPAIDFYVPFEALWEASAKKLVGSDTTADDWRGLVISFYANRGVMAFFSAKSAQDRAIDVAYCYREMMAHTTDHRFDGWMTAVEGIIAQIELSILN